MTWKKRLEKLAAGALLLVGALGCGPGDAASLEQRLAVSDPFERARGFAEFLDRATPEQLPEIRAALDAERLGYGEIELALLGTWWARFDPEAAAEWASEDWRVSDEILGSIFRTWAHTAPADAFAGIQGPGQGKGAAIYGVVTGWHESGQPGLVDQIRQVPDLAARQRTAESLASRLVLALGAEGALAFVDEIQPPAFQRMIALRVASASAGQGYGPEIAEWARPHVTEGEERPSGFPRRIATRWILEDPTAAWEWLESLPAGEDRDDGVSEAYRDWLRFDPNAAMVWMEYVGAKDPEPWIEPALALFALRISQNRPEWALELVRAFDDAKLRDRFTLQIAQGWMRRDPEAAQSWIASAELEDDLRSKIEKTRRGRVRS